MRISQAHGQRRRFAHIERSPYGRSSKSYERKRTRTRYDNYVNAKTLKTPNYTPEVSSDDRTIVSRSDHRNPAPCVQTKRNDAKPISSFVGRNVRIDRKRLVG